MNGTTTDPNVEAFFLQLKDKMDVGLISAPDVEYRRTASKSVQPLVPVMAIKRVIYEVDDSSDTQEPTSAPTSLRGDDEQKQIAVERGTGPPAESEEVISSVAPAQPLSRQGRTWPDLISESVGDERIIVPLLMFLPFIFYPKKLEAFKDSVAVGTLLVGLWLLSSFIRWWRQR